MYPNRSSIVASPGRQAGAQYSYANNVSPHKHTLTYCQPGFVCAIIDALEERNCVCVVCACVCITYVLNYSPPTLRSSPSSVGKTSSEKATSMRARLREQHQHCRSCVSVCVSRFKTVYCSFQNCIFYPSVYYWKQLVSVRLFFTCTSNTFYCVLLCVRARVERPRVMGVWNNVTNASAR